MKFAECHQKTAEFDIRFAEFGTKLCRREGGGVKMVISVRELK